ncbi:response regulator [Pseudomonas tritici]|uniref:response regulator n=1 Tax=Pseudomonas tritici TaxID=2745518 RepID=UPI00387AC0E3
MKALILDDSRTDTYLAIQVATQFFDAVEAYGTPAELHAALKQEPLPELILLDVHVGDLHNGINELDTIKSAYVAASLIPIIVVTASTDESLHSFALSCGAEAVIVKPISVEKLESVLRLSLPEVVLERARVRAAKSKEECLMPTPNDGAAISGGGNND